MGVIGKLGLVVVVAVASLAVQASEPTTHDMSAGECWTKAMNAGDADALAMCYAPDALMWFSGGGLAKGREATQKGYAGYFAGYTIKDARLIEMGHEDGEAPKSLGARSRS